MGEFVHVGLRTAFVSVEDILVQFQKHAEAFLGLTELCKTNPSNRRLVGLRSWSLLFLDLVCAAFCPPLSNKGGCFWKR